MIDVDVMISGTPQITWNSTFSSTASALATAWCFEHPYERVAEKVAQEIQQFYENTVPPLKPLTKEQVEDALQKYGIKYINEQALVDAAISSGDWSDLRHECSSQNKQGVLQIILLSHPEKLALAIDNPASTNDPNVPTSIDGPLLHEYVSGIYAIVRAGFDTTRPVGRYLDVLMSLSPVESPTPITWDNVSKNAGIVAVYAIMPKDVEVPPSDFRYFGGLDANGNPQDNQWPIVEKSFDPAPIIDSIKASMSSSDTTYSTQIQQINQLGSQIAASLSNVANLVNQDKQSSDTAFMSLLQQLGYKGDTAPPSQPTSAREPSIQPTQAPSSDGSTVNGDTSGQATGNTTQPLEQPVTQGVL